MASLLSRRICRTLFSSKPSNFSYSFCTKSLSSAETESESDELTPPDSPFSDADSDPFLPSSPSSKPNNQRPTPPDSLFSDADSDPFLPSSPSSKPNNQRPAPPDSLFSDADSDPFLPSSPSSKPNNQRPPLNWPLENGLDAGIYKAILVGQVGQAPLQKKLKNGRTVTLLSLGTGGIRNNRRPNDNEEPRDYAHRSAVQWHRVSVYPDKLAELAGKNIVPGSLLYVEGNLETKIFNDPKTGLPRRIREIAVRRNGRLVFLGQGSDAQKFSLERMTAVGYY